MNEKGPRARLRLNNTLALITGDDPSAAQIVAAAQGDGLPVRSSAGDEPADFAHIDPALAVGWEYPFPAPPPGVGYAGLTPAQRGALLVWLDAPGRPAARAFLRLYLAQLELRLLQGKGAAEQALDALLQLSSADAWQADEEVGRTLLLAHWLGQNGEGLAAALASGTALAHAGLALGWQALLGRPLSAQQVVRLAPHWLPDQPAVPHEVVRLRLASLKASLGEPVLSYALAQLGPEASAPRHWRSAHPGISYLLPQPDLRRSLLPLLAEVLSAPTTAGEESAQRERSQDGIAGNSGSGNSDGDDDAAPAAAAAGWQLILEFGHSRSEFFDYVLHQAERMEGFAQLMDEDRRLVYRVAFRKGKLRSFWRLWETVQNWSTTRVYLNGRELEKWKIWPYSQYLQ